MPSKRNCRHRYLRAIIDPMVREVKNVQCVAKPGHPACGGTFTLVEINRQRVKRGDQPIEIKVRPLAGGQIQ